MHRSCQFGKFRTNNTLNLIIEGNMSLNFPTVPKKKYPSPALYFLSQNQRPPVLIMKTGLRYGSCFKIFNQVLTLRAGVLLFRDTA